MTSSMYGGQRRVTRVLPLLSVFKTVLTSVEVVERSFSALTIQHSLY